MDIEYVYPMNDGEWVAVKTMDKPEMERFLGELVMRTAREALSGESGQAAKPDGDLDGFVDLLRWKIADKIVNLKKKSRHWKREAKKLLVMVQTANDRLDYWHGQAMDRGATIAQLRSDLTEAKTMLEELGVEPRA